MGERNSMGDRLFEIIDVNGNGSISKKELCGFLFVMFQGCENDGERAAVKFLGKSIGDCAERNGVGDDGEITKQMLDDYEGEEPPEELAGPMESIFTGIMENADDIEKMTKAATEADQEEVMGFLME